MGVSFCDGTMVKVTEKDGQAKWVCNKDESHVRIMKKEKKAGGTGVDFPPAGE